MNQYGQPIGCPVAADADRATPGREPMLGRYCRLEPLDPVCHASDLYTNHMQAPDERDWTYLPVDRPPTPQLFGVFLNRLATSTDSVHYVVIDARTGKSVGTAALGRSDPRNGVVEIGGVMFSPPMQRTASATETIYLLLRRVFGELAYRRCEWKCDSLNAASRVAAQRLGFTYEGTFRNAVVYKGRNRDTAWFSIIADEWPLVRDSLESWLDPGNFDERGQQRRSLREIRAALKA